MLIQCTKKLLDDINIKPGTPDQQPIYSWHANLLTIDRRKTIILMNDCTRYVIVLYGLKSKDKKNFGDIIMFAIQETLLAEGIRKEVVEQYIKASPGVVFAKTKDKSTVAKLNKACDSVYFYSRSFDTDSLVQVKVSGLASRDPYYTGKSDLIYPNEEMYKALETLIGQCVFQNKALQIKVALELESLNVWRRLMIPYNITFEQLHGVLQLSFNWRDCHLHDFEIIDKNKPIIRIIQGEDDFEFPSDLPRRVETGVPIAEYLPKYKQLRYRYDFGDGWEHSIEVEDLIFNYDKNYPECIDGKGNAPPEDVGGEGGLEEFLKIINDPHNKEYPEMKAWASMQLYCEYNIDQINRSLKYSWFREY